MKDTYLMTEILASLNKCVLSDFLGGGYSLYSNKTFTEGEFNTLADVVMLLRMTQVSLLTSSKILIIS